MLIDNYFFVDEFNNPISPSLRNSNAYICGQIYNRAGFRDGDVILTSRIKARSRWRIETEHSVYTLGGMNCSYAAAFKKGGSGVCNWSVQDYLAELGMTVMQNDELDKTNALGTPPSK